MTAPALPDPLDERAEARGKTRVGTRLRGAGEVLDLRIQEGFALIFLHAGGLTLEIEGRDVRFTFATGQQSSQSWMGTPQPLLSATALADLQAAPPRLSASDALSAILRAAILTLDRLQATPAQAPLAPLVSGALALYVEEARREGALSGEGVGHPAVAAARALVRRWLGGPVRIEALAAEAGVAPGYLVRLFRRELGVTPSEYLWEERVRYGASLLRDTQISVAEVASQAGFASAKHFARRIRAAYGLTPRAIRQGSASPAGA